MDAFEDARIRWSQFSRSSEGPDCLEPGARYGIRGGDTLVVGTDDAYAAPDELLTT